MQINRRLIVKPETPWHWVIRGHPREATSGRAPPPWRARPPIRGPNNTKSDYKRLYLVFEKWLQITCDICEKHWKQMFFLLIILALIWYNK